MLTRLDIQGLAIIDSLSIQFSPGFNIITGETGAGKSILIKALGLLLGAKASGETVRHGKDAATITGIFEVPVGHKSLLFLENMGIETQSEDFTSTLSAIIIRRIVTNRGRSTGWVNDIPVTIATLKELSPFLIDIFGQHENLRMLDASQHIHYVDLFLKNPDILTEYQEAYRSTTHLLDEIRNFLATVHTKKRDADYLDFRCSELKNFGPTIDDYKQVKNICQQSSLTIQLLHGLEKARTSMDQGGSGEPLSRVLWDTARLLSKLQPLAEVVKPLAEEASLLASKLDDLSFNVGKTIASLELDENKLESAQTRLAGYQELFRKLSVSDIENFIQESNRLFSELAMLNTANEQLTVMLNQLGEQTKNAFKLAEQLSKERLHAKDLVKRQMTRELRELVMPEAKIDIEFIKVTKPPLSDLVATIGPSAMNLWREILLILEKLGENGAERAQFLMATNKGEAMLPIHKIASGGEISRVMLALKRALAAGAESCILVFDEIDSGISGRVADVVGRKMQDLSMNFQVICISHLPQVAAYADTHFLVHKYGRSNRTESTITQLTPLESAKEIARLLSGEEITEVSLENAKSLIRKARISNKSLTKSP